MIPKPLSGIISVKTPKPDARSSGTPPGGKRSHVRSHNENPRDMPIDYRRNALSKRCKYKIHFIYSNHNDFQYILK